ncbi:hypothetical protein [Pararhodonellum marinum]|uniref:hypothetical protein n=1 Tax=Pararhodonellum marinum TaxID=2755358 RepID=UPI00188FD0B2|nr:hypothetical protein [Pararhodonellum marinum]
MKHRIQFFFFLGCFGMYFPLFAQENVRDAWLGVRMGLSYSPLKDFQTWGEGEGLDNLPAATRHQQIAFDVFIQKRKIPFLLSTAINLPRLTQTHPYLTSISLESGYTLYEKRTTLRIMAGPSLGIMTVRFRGGVPQSFQNLPFNHSEAFARSYNLALRGSLLATYPIFPKNKRFGRPSVLANVGIQERLLHGGFRYGEMVIVPDDRFDSVPVEMPKLFRRNMWATVGIGFHFN